MNEFVDMHVHSKFSIDGMSTMEDSLSSTSTATDIH